ncbi:MAG: ABC transporter substrate-binding protein [Treponema sp.]|jgi:iron complex transport system substrate-binding protein|nr:ABC transporter substrate-binding protein [Treponema sp.]
MVHIKTFLYCLILLAPGLTGVFPQEQSAFPLSIRDVLGRSLSVPAAPRRVVSLSPGVTEILFAIGAGDQVVGLTEYCNYPPETASRTKVGGFSGITVNMETLARLKPDMVIISAFMHGRLIALLERLSIPFFAVEPQNFQEVYETIAALGSLTGHVRGSQEVIGLMQEKIRRVQERRGNRQAPLVFWELSDEPLMSAGGKTFISEAISLGGGKNIFEDIDEAWPLVSTEQVVRRKPDWIIAGDDHGKIIEPRSLARRPGWGVIPAVRQNHIALVNADTLYRYGPRLADAVVRIADILYE